MVFLALKLVIYIGGIFNNNNINFTQILLIHIDRYITARYNISQQDISLRDISRYDMKGR
jgi:hypothetical protein